MPLFKRTDKWESIREPLGQTAQLAKDTLDSDPEIAAQALMAVSPADRAGYSDYLAFLSRGARSDPKGELELFDPSTRDAVAVRLLSVASEKCGVIQEEWTVAVDDLALIAIADQALPLLDRINSVLSEKGAWELVETYHVGGLLSSAAHLMRSRTSSAAVPGGLEAAQVRGMFAQGEAACRTGDEAGAKRIWKFASIYCSSTSDPALQRCQDALGM